MGKGVKLSFLFLIGIIAISVLGILGTTNIAKADSGVSITYKFVNVDDKNKELNKLEEDRSVGESIKYTPPETISVDGKDYTRVEIGEVNETNLTEDKEIILEYTEKQVGAKPEGVVPAENSGQGMVDVNTAMWRLKDGKIETTIDVEVVGKHMATRLGTVSQEVGKDTEEEKGEEITKTETSMSKSGTFEDGKYTDTNQFTLDTEGKYKAKVSYWYTNLATGNYECETGSEERCFEWVLNEEKPYTPYWGEFDETIEIDGEVVRTTNIYELEIDLELDDVSNKDYTVEELPESLPIGKGIEDKTNVITGRIDSNSGLVTSYSERFSIQPQTDFVLGTQQGVEVSEYIGYENDFGDTLTVSGNPVYYIGNIDNNLKDELEQDSEFGSKVGLVYNEGTQAFELSKVFGLSNTYGVQFIADKTDFLLGTSEEDLTKELNKEIKNQGLGEDTLVNLDYLKSRYFLPVDDTKYTDEDMRYQDTVVLDGIGLNNLSLKYKKNFTVETDLVSEEDTAKFKGYEQVIEMKEEKEYPESETFSEEELKGYLQAYETAEKYNVFRDTDDGNLEMHIKEVEELNKE